MDTDKSELRTLYDSPNHLRNVDGNQIEFRLVRWCVTHDFPSTFTGNMCYKAEPPFNDCEFVDKLVEV